MSTTARELDLPLPDPKELHNFGWAEVWLGRGGHPTSKGYHWLAEQGFEALVNLRVHKESKAALKANPQFTLIHIPVKNNRAPSDEESMRWLQICQANHRRKRMYVHCDAGAGRTSTFCVLLRIAQGVALEKAFAEEEHFGFKPQSEHKMQAQYLADFVRKVQNNELSVPDLRRE